MAEKCFCYCIGGTGARIAEVAAHLCTMNMLNDKNITFIVVDKDEECGGTKRAKKVISYTEVISEIKGSDSNSGRLCRSRLSSKEDGNPTKAPWNFTKAIENIQGNNNGNASLKNALGGNNSDNEILFDAFYSKSEQDSSTSEGFYGHPSIGALMFKYMMKNTNDDIAEPVLNYLTGHTGDVVKVFIIGSVFGGTGASVFSNLAAHIRDKSSGMNNINNRLLISGVLLLPYFSFGASTNENPRINDMEFFAKSRTALEQYIIELENPSNSSGINLTQRLCPFCHNDLLDNFGRAKTKYIAVIGVSASGKTTFLSAVNNQLRENSKFTWMTMSAKASKSLEGITEKYREASDKARVSTKDINGPFFYRLDYSGSQKPDPRTETDVVFFDVPGEYYAKSEKSIGNCRIILHMRMA